MGKNRFLKVIFKKRPFSRNVDTFGYMGQNNFSMRSKDKYHLLDFFIVISKRYPYSRNVDIYVDIGYSELGGQSRTLTCCGGA